MTRLFIVTLVSMIVFPLPTGENIKCVPKTKIPLRQWIGQEPYSSRQAEVLESHTVRFKEVIFVLAIQMIDQVT